MAERPRVTLAYKGESLELDFSIHHHFRDRLEHAPKMFCQFAAGAPTAHVGSSVRREIWQRELDRTWAEIKDLMVQGKGEDLVGAEPRPISCSLALGPRQPVDWARIGGCPEHREPGVDRETPLGLRCWATAEAT